MPQNLLAKTSVYFLDAARTPLGRPFKSLKEFSVGQLAGNVIAALLKRSDLLPKKVTQVILGNTVSAGNGQNCARQAALLGGLLPSTNAFSVNSVCGSGLQSIILAAQTIALGAADCIIAGGAESASRTPQLFSKLIDEPYSQRTAIDSLFYDGLWCSLSGKSMGQICQALADKEKISRLEQDQYALDSHFKAAAGKFDKELIGINIAGAKVLSSDEHVRQHLSLENFQLLPASFSENGTITPGNASVACDGAAAIVVAGEHFVKTQSRKPLARLIGFTSLSLEPHDVFTAAVPAVQACLRDCGLQLSDIDIFEVSEAFAAQVIYTRNKLKIPAEKMNIYGGDIALGHPLGAAGARILVTLVHALKTENKKYGLAVICYGGGGAIAMIVANERKIK